MVPKNKARRPKINPAMNNPVTPKIAEITPK